MSVARALQQRGRQVTVFERDEFAAGCSVGNAGLVVPSHVVPLAAPGVIRQGLRWLLRRDSPFRIKPRVDLGLLKWLWTFYNACSEEHVHRSVPLLRDLNLRSRSIYEAWSNADELDDFGFQSTGLLMLHKTEEGREEDLKEAEYARDAGLEVSVLSEGEVEQITPHLPSSTHGGVHYHQDALLDPMQLILTLRRTLERNGVSLYEGVAATGFVRENGRIQAIRTSEGRVHAKEVILAAGAWSSTIGKQLGIHVPVEPAKGYSVTFEVSDNRPEVPFILTEEKVSVTPLGNRMRFAGTLELAGFDSRVDRRRVGPILKVAEEYTDFNPEQLEEENVWVGFRPCTPDGLPIIGPVPEYENLTLATGHSMMGISLAPITGQLVAEHLVGDPPSVEMAPLHVRRFY